MSCNLLSVHLIQLYHSLALSYIAYYHPTCLLSYCCPILASCSSAFTLTLNGPLFVLQIVCVWELKNAGSKDRSPVQLQLKHTLHGHFDAVTCIAASSAYNIIVSGSKVRYLALFLSLSLSSLAPSSALPALLI